MATTHVDGYRTWYRKEGAAGSPPLLLLHGAGGSHHVWRHQFPALSARFRCLAPDLPAHSQSDGAPPASVSAIAHWAARFLDALAVDEPVVVCGHSLGSLAAVAFAAAFPGRTRALVVAAGGSRLRVGASFLRGLKARGYDRFLFESAFSRSLPPGVFQEWWYWSSARTRVEVMVHDFEVASQADVSREAPTVRAPTLLVHGAEDRWVPLRAAQHLQQLIPAARLEVIPQAAHYVMLEKPGEFNRAVESIQE